MAALTPAQIELASSLTQDELPTRFRCAVCNKLAINAFRLPCCETAICDNCQSTLPSSCPVCEHSPVSGDDCTPYKALRTTIRVFLKTEEKKREAARPKTNASAPPTPVEPSPAPTPAVVKPPTEPPATDTTLTAQAQDDSVTAEKNGDEPSAPVGAEADANASAPPDGSEPHQDEPALEQPGEQHIADEEGHNTADSQQLDNFQQDGQEHETEDPSGQSFDDESNANGDFNGMNGNGGDMNPMQFQMMMMQNGMNPAAFGGFPMMGMGMNMDPSAMQNMYMNGGFGVQGMGMNGMNMMNMGMNGFNGGGNDWNDQQSWQDNFNPNASGMGNGDFGNFNPRFHGGYNQGNFGQNQFNHFGRGGWQPRGRGRGRGYYNRGGFGRGGYNPAFNPRHQGQQQGWGQENGHHNAQMQQTGPDESGEPQKAADTDEFGRSLRSGQEQEGQPDDQGADQAEPKTGDGDHESTGQVPTENASGEAHDDSAMVNGDVPSADPYSRSHGSSYGIGTVPPAAPDVPLNAPTGPKAMRQGLPNTSSLHLRARGLMQEPSPAVTNAPAVESPHDAEKAASRSSSRHSRKESDRRSSDPERAFDYDKEKRRSHDRDRDYDRSRSYSRSRSRSRSPERDRSRDRKDSRRHRRHRSESISDDERDDDSRRRKHRSRRSTRDDDEYRSRPKGDKHGDRSRSVSLDQEREHKRSGHRSHRDRDRDRDRDRERDRESDREYRKKSSHRSHYDRDREREKDRERDRERDKDRKKDRDREREHRHRSSRKTSAEPPTPVEPLAKEFNPPTGPRGSVSAAKGSSSKLELSIKGASSKSKSSSSTSHRRDSEMSSSRRGSQVSTSNAPKGAPSGPAKDPHTLEREKRDRERLLKEAQRMAGLNGLAGLKRARDAGDDRSGRRKNRRSEAVYGDAEEQRMRRLEEEREGGRWD